MAIDQEPVGVELNDDLATRLLLRLLLVDVFYGVRGGALIF